MSKLSTQPLKGFRDFLPKETLKRQWLKNEITKVFEKWGYEPIETPTLEPLEIFEGQIGDDEKLFYKFKDAGDRNVALRYDQSVPTARFVAEHRNEISMPFRRYQMQNVFRAEKPQKGRYREFMQCDVDIFGVASPLADAEVIAVGLDVYRSLGVKNAKLLISDRSLLQGFPYEAIVCIDKLKKIGEDGVISEMIKKGIKEEEAKRYLFEMKNIKPNENLQMIFNYLESQGFDESWYKFDPTIARSFSYSSGPIWEIVIEDAFESSVLGGERYDGLIESISGVKIEATGFGLGFDRTLEALEVLNLIPENLLTKTDVLVTVFDDSLISESSKTSYALRSFGLNVEMYSNPTDKLGKQIKYALNKGIKWVVVIGPDEVKEGMVVLKNLETEDQKKVKIEEVGGYPELGVAPQKGR